MASTAMRTPRFPVPVMAPSSQPDSGRGCLFLRRLDLQHGPAGVVAAVRARVMAPLGLVAVRALLELRQREREMRASIALSSVGDPALGHAHVSRCSFRYPIAWRRPSRACVSAKMSFGIGTRL